MVWQKKPWGPKIADKISEILKLKIVFYTDIVFGLNSIYHSLLQAATSWCKAECKKLFFFLEQHELYFYPN